MMPLKKNGVPKRPRVVFILPALTAGGAERVLITLMNGIDREKFEPVFITVNEDGPLRDLIDPTIPFYALGRGTRVSRTLHRLFFRLRALQPDLVVSTMAHMNYGVLLLKPLFPRTRFIVREAITPSFFLDRGRTEVCIIRLLYRLLYPRADKVISPAQLIIDELRALGIPAEKQVLLPNPVDSDDIRASGSVEPRAGVQYVCAGRLDGQKGFDRLIAALPQLRREKDWHLTILGEGRQRTELENLIAKEGLAERITLAGHVARPWPVIAAADVFLMPSRYEGLPNAALEALACGTPVIATRTAGGIAEIAAQAAPGDVTVVDDMDGFISALAEVERRPEVVPRPSLLPAMFEKRAVLAQFENICREQVD